MPNKRDAERNTTKHPGAKPNAVVKAVAKAQAAAKGGDAVGAVASAAENKKPLPNAGYCSPKGEKEYKKSKTCFTREALVRLVQAWNEANISDKIAFTDKTAKQALWQALNKRMFSVCKGSGREWCWVDKLKPGTKDAEIEQSLRPAKPHEWYKDEYTWLSNYEIEDVMQQYEDIPENKYKFLGVFPMDFAKKDSFGACLFKEICSLDVGKYARKGIKHIGMITNLDYHNQSGSHWTSLFACIDPDRPCFGAYYYDSVAPTHPPPEIQSFMNTLKTQAEAYAKSIGKTAAVFRIDHNRVRHQYGNSECGIFSMAYQVQWLDKLEKNPMTVFDDFAKVKWKDEYIHQLRDIFFRPNTREVVGGKKKLKSK